MISSPVSSPADKCIPLFNTQGTTVLNRNNLHDYKAGSFKDVRMMMMMMPNGAAAAATTTTKNVPNGISITSTSSLCNSLHSSAVKKLPQRVFEDEEEQQQQQHSSPTSRLVPLSNHKYAYIYPMIVL